MNARRFSARIVLAAAVGLALTATTAYAYWPWETVSVTSHYDSSGVLVGVEAHGACGFPLYGTTGVHVSNRSILCEDIDQVELPY